MIARFLATSCGKRRIASRAVPACAAEASAALMIEAKRDERMERRLAPNQGNTNHERKTTSVSCPAIPGFLRDLFRRLESASHSELCLFFARATFVLIESCLSLSW